MFENAPASLSPEFVVVFILFLFQNLLVYNWQQKQLAIGPFTYEPLDNIDNLLRMPDQFYRKVGTHSDRVLVTS